MNPYLYDGARLIALLDPEPAGGDWRLRALCAQTEPEAFFPDKGGTTRPAKAVCMACPVRAECLQEALDNEEPFGVWGGLSERERRKLLGKTEHTCPDCGLLCRSHRAMRMHQGRNCPAREAA